MAGSRLKHLKLTYGQSANGGMKMRRRLCAYSLCGACRNCSAKSGEDEPERDARGESAAPGMQEWGKKLEPAPVLAPNRPVADGASANTLNE